MGNQAILRMLSHSSPRIQTKLTVNEPGDRFEQEADQVADRVMRMAAPPTEAASQTAAKPSSHYLPGVQRTCACGDTCSDCQQNSSDHDHEIQRKPSAPTTSAPTEAPPIVHEVLRSPGQPLDSTTRAFMEPRFGQDFGNVRIHTDPSAAASARSVNARAYTAAQNIVFGSGQFAPSTNAGRRLLAHELAHVVQQASKGSAARPSLVSGPTLQRQPLTVAPAPVAPEPPTSTEPSAPSTEPSAPSQTAANDGKKKDVTHVYDRVDLIVVSCKDSRIAFETRSATHIYPLTRCDKSIPKGDYTADVTDPADSTELGLTFHGSDHQTKHAFRGSYSIPHGHPLPSDLLKGQDTVKIRYAEDFSSSGLLDLRPECLITFPTQTLFAAKSDTKDLTSHLPKVPKLRWPLVDLGIAGVDLRLGVEASAKAGYSYTEGKLDDICIAPTPRHPFAGRASFSVSGQADIHLDVTLGVEIDATVLEGLITVSSAHAELKLDLDAAVKGDVQARLIEISFNPLASDTKDRFSLKTNIELAALAAIAANLSGSAGIDFLGFNLWTGHLPDIAHANLAYGWTGGLSFDNSFLPQPMLGSFAKASPQQISAGKLRTPGTKRLAKDTDSIPIKDLVESWIHGSEGEPTSDGLSCDKALPIHWFKPRTPFYPKKLSFNTPGVFPSEVTQEQDPLLVSHPTVTPPPKWYKPSEPSEPIVGPTPIGVSSSNWPETGNWAHCFQYLPFPSSRAESDAFRELLKGLDTRFDGLSIKDGKVQMDHVRELQFGGKDRFDNLWPFDASANQSAGSLHQKQIEAYRKMFPKDFAGRYFRIASIGLDPEKASKLDK